MITATLIAQQSPVLATNAPSLDKGGPYIVLPYSITRKNLSSLPLWRADQCSAIHITQAANFAGF